MKNLIRKILKESEFEWSDTVEDPWINVSDDMLNQIDQDDLDRIVSILDNEIDLSKSDAYEWDVCHSTRFEIQEVIIDEEDDIVIAYISYCNEVPTHLSLWFNRDTHDYNIA
jgi:hypothetical protein